MCPVYSPSLDLKSITCLEVVWKNLKTLVPGPDWCLLQPFESVRSRMKTIVSAFLQNNWDWQISLKLKVFLDTFWNPTRYHMKIYQTGDRLLFQIQLTKRSLQFSLIYYQIGSIITRFFMLARRVHPNSRDVLNITPFSILYFN